MNVHIHKDQSMQCMYCHNIYCEECINAECDWCINYKYDQSLCPHCSITVNEFEQNICIECIYYGVFNGQIVFCFDCSELCPSNLLNDTEHENHNVLSNKNHIIDIISMKYPIIANSGKILFNKDLDGLNIID